MDKNLPIGSRILVLDFGSQYSQLIARCIRELEVYCVVQPWDWNEAAIKDLAPDAVILSGGPNSAFSGDTVPIINQAVIDLAVPILGICYGMQLMAMQCGTGGSVSVADFAEYGSTSLTLSEHALFSGIKQKQLEVWMSHGDQVDKAPAEFEVIAKNAKVPCAAMANDRQRFYGLQFHPEVSHSQCGKQILHNFVFNIAGCQAGWKLKDIRSSLVAAIGEQVGTQRVILAISGGVDSSVAAALLHEAIGDRLICVFVDNGLLRLNEVKQVEEQLQTNLGIAPITIDASATFLTALKGVSEPEQKRQIIGATFIKVFEKQAASLGDVSFLAQGTIYSDVIESAVGSKSAKTIKSHHNVGGLPAHMNMDLVEPIRHLFKDEVRKLGVELGLPQDILYRHPFPGPGLAVRILGEINSEALRITREADAIFMELLRQHHWYEKLSQAFAVFIPVSSVGVAGDKRVYAPIIALRAVQTDDFMTARWANLPSELLASISTAIINQVKGISRVVYDISNKPPATIEWE